jgi:exodeoxyribonuclease VII large subunit
LEQRLIRVVGTGLSERRRTLAQLASHLRQRSPALRVAAARGRLDVASKTLSSALRRGVATLDSRLRLAAGKLNTVSPLATLQRGYAIVTDADGTVITDATAVKKDAVIQARLARGTLQARVEQIDSNEPSNDEKQ